MIVRAMDRFYARHPRIAFCIALVAAFAVLYVASDWDKSDTAALRMQMFAARGA
ncbi:hypothetical protein [Paraburkholderia sp.]|uniref:hypothetical protein n=1 Tax=Paraburkholderia sp. TaxID=1926495 RepID=UPI003C7AF3D1